MRVLGFLLLMAASADAVENALPQAAPPSRYEQTLAQSPFALATKQEAAVAPQDVFSANWVLTGLSRLPNDQGVMEDFVTIRSRDQRTSFSIFGSEINGDKEGEGVTIVKVERAEDSKKSYVMLRKGDEVGRVEFNPEVSAAQPGPPVVQGQPGAVVRPSFPPVGGSVPAINSAANQNRAPNIIRPTLPRPQAGPGMTGGGPGANMGSGGPGAPSATINPMAGEHRRVRVIQSQTQ